MKAAQRGQALEQFANAPGLLPFARLSCPASSSQRN
jgi:hypothetical protein